jgi:hypothetical protein
MSYKTYGLDTLAILYAMPYALLMWSYVLSKLLQRALCTHSLPLPSIVAFLAAFMYTCFFSSSSTTRLPVGIVLLIVGGLVVLCIRTGWINESNGLNVQSPRDDLGDSHRAILARDSKAEEQKASTDTFTWNSTGEGKEGGKRQRIWPLMHFVRRPTPDSLVQSGGNGNNIKAEV